MKKRLIIEIIVLIIILSFCLLYWQSFNLQKQVALYHYDQAYAYLDQLDNQKSTEHLVKAIEWDPQLDSKEFNEFKKYRQELLTDLEKNNKFFNQ